MNEHQEEKLPFTIFTYKWELTAVSKSRKTILSRMIQFRGENIFRAGLQNHEYEYRGRFSSLLFLTSDLAKLGLKVDTVLYSVSSKHHGNSEIEKMNVRIGKPDDKFGKVQLFTASPSFGDGIVSGDITYNFQVYITGVVEDYQVYQKDTLLNEQLWLPTGGYQNGADFEIIAAGNKVFPVHKFILAARSPVFEAQFNNKKTKLNQQIFDDVDAATMEQFLKFVYTGELEGSIKSLKLKELASTYQIKTLEKISEAAAEGMDGDDMVQWVLQLKPEDGKNSIEIRSGANSKGEFSLNSVVLNYMWNWNQWKELDLSTTSAEAFHYKKEKLFRAQVKTGTRSMSREICHELVATLLSCRGQRSGCKIQKVDCSLTMNHKDRNWIWEEMNEKVDASDEGMLQMFTKNATKAKSWQISNDYSPPFAITFHVKVVNTIANYDFKFIDMTWEKQIWNAVVNRKFTDVELLVGDQSFAAHRFILSARSPVFAAMFNSGMAEAQTGQVRIDDVEPNIFRIFLEFLYIGSLKSFEENEQLFTLADKYQVETLMTLCQPTDESVDVEDFTKALLAYAY